MFTLGDDLGNFLMAEGQTPGRLEANSIARLGQVAIGAPANPASLPRGQPTYYGEPTSDPTGFRCVGKGSLLSRNRRSSCAVMW
jgi:hypothetical protein